MSKNKWFLNGGRGSGRTVRLLCETYENKIAELKKACDETQELLDKQIEATYKLDKENAELKVSCKIQVDTAFQMIYEKDDQLTKAKDFILKLTTYLEGHTNYDFEYELIKEVKQFLSEVEK